MKAIKIAILKLVFLLIVLIGTIAAYFVFTYEKTEDPAESISTATLPVITMKYREQNINVLNGYTNEMQGKYMRQALTPYGEDGTVTLDIERYANVIAAISYQVRSVDTERHVPRRVLINRAVLPVPGILSAVLRRAVHKSAVRRMLPALLPHISDRNLW